MGFFYILHIAICIILIAVILFQDGKTGGLVSVPDSSQAVFGAKGASNFLTKLTSILAVVFMAVTMILAYSGGPSESIASGHVPTQPDGPGTITAPVDSGSDVQKSAVDPVTGESIDIGLGGEDAENVKDVEVVRGTENLPPEIREGIEREEKRKQAEEAAKKAREEQQKKDQDEKEDQDN
jgi:preprotein translocase subunit SecG